MWHADPDRQRSALVRARWPLIVAAIVAGAVLQHLVAAPPAQAPANPPASHTPAHQSAPALYKTFT